MLLRPKHRSGWGTVDLGIESVRLGSREMHYAIGKVGRAREEHAHIGAGLFQ